MVLNQRSTICTLCLPDTVPTGAHQLVEMFSSKWPVMQQLHDNYMLAWRNFSRQAVQSAARKPIAASR
ncbi:hypothetical protein KC347_g104 [Hortaea werneckii]|nr:hypothetical protein KC347_g104 [Hortaea werneckii]